jgi:3-deoxy-manno-octulosonate cytidylyltransferase (CMP-KDO synthetase)
MQAAKPCRLLVATDHRDIADEAARFGGEARLTSRYCNTGTDRVAEVARGLPNAEILINVQGDEPEVTGEAIDQLVDLLDANPHAAMATLATPIRDQELLDDPSCVKVVLDRAGRALYFSRSAIPHARDFHPELLHADPPHYHQHIGIYAYRRDFLLRFASLRQSPLEKLENLEQLRVLEAGYSIAVATIEEASVGIDTLEDYQAFVARRKAG